MAESGGRLLTGLLEGVNEAMGRLEMPSSSSEAANVAVAVAVGVGVTAVAGVAVAAGVGAIYLYQQGKRRPWEKTKKPPTALNPSEWMNSFEEEDGRLKGGGEKVIGRVRRGGVHPTIRNEVWPFLLGLYDGNSTERDRDSQRVERSEDYEDLRKQVREKTAKIRVMAEKRKELMAKEEAEEEKKAAAIAEDTSVVTDEAMLASRDEEDETSESAPLLSEDGEPGASKDPHRKPQNGASDAPGTAASRRADTDVSTQDRAVGDAPRALGPGGATAAARDPEWTALEEFETWQRIIRLDAVRMNAQWIPYEEAYPHGQAVVTTEEAEALSEFVGLFDDSHLEPCRRKHAARLVAILEAYAVHDPEIGYCQGMSDLLSPFVALLEEDSEAFWCFERFMQKARHNFRVDEVGIRKQLDSIAKILSIADPAFFQYLVRIKADDCIFAYRMVVVIMRRELSFEQTLTLWEVIWAEAAAAAASDAADAAATAAGGTVVRKKAESHATSELLLYIVAAAIRKKKKVITEKCKGMDEVLKEMNTMAGLIDIWSLVADAREMVKAVQGAV